MKVPRLFNKNRKLSQFSKFLEHPTFHNVVVLYGVYSINFLVPLITIPYLARVLGPSYWGLLAFSQSFALYLNVILEYGFNLSATREVARANKDRTRLGELLAGVMGAKLFLFIICLIFSLVIKNWIGPFRENPALFWGALFFSFGQSFSPIWYFQGLERMKIVGILEFITKILATILIFITVRSPESAWKVLFLNGLATLLSSLMALGFAYYETPFKLPTLASVGEAFRLGWSMFLFRSSVSLYTAGNTFILGFFVPIRMVGYYAGAEKICKALVGLLTPINQAIFPRLSNLTLIDKEKAARIARLSFKVMTGLGLAMGITAFVGAPYWTRIFLGPGYEESVGVLRIFSILPVLIAMSNVLGIQWMLPLGMDKKFNSIIITAGAINILLAIFLASRFSYLGMAWAVLIAEAFVTIAIFWHLRKLKMIPFNYYPQIGVAS